MATTTSYNASYVGCVRGLTTCRTAFGNASDVAATANGFAIKVQTALASPVLTAPKQDLLTALCASFFEGRYQVGAVADASVSAICAAYTTITANIVD